MLKHIALVTATLFLGLFSFGQQSIDQAQSKVKFEVSNMAFNTVEGTFGAMKGTVSFLPNQLGNAHINACIETATINTENAKRDEHLLTPDFFDANRYPEICFTSESIQKGSSGYIAIGNLSMHGVTRKVEIPFTYQNNTITGQLTIQRSDYQVGSDGSFMVGQEVNIEIIAVLK